MAQAAKKTNLREYGIVGALIAIVILFQLLTGGKLLMPDNVASLFQQNAYVMILAIGMVTVSYTHLDVYKRQAPGRRRGR